jgi:hypothetical protein
MASGIPDRCSSLAKRTTLGDLLSIKDSAPERDAQINGEETQFAGSVSKGGTRTKIGSWLHEGATLSPLRE